MKIRSQLLILTALSGAAFSKIDSLVLVEGNNWAYRKKIESGLVLTTFFDGVTRGRIDSIRPRNDSLLFWTSWKDSSVNPEIKREYSMSYAVVNDTVYATGSDVGGNYSQSPPPLFMFGSELSGSLTYVFFDNRIRFLNKWEFHPSSYGTTTLGAYLQGVGLISYDEYTFGSMTREKLYLKLLEYNGTVFDSTKIESLDPTPITSRKSRAIPGAGSRGAFSWKGKVHTLAGRRNF